MVDVFLPLALAFIMFSLGLALHLADFRQVLREPAHLLLGLCGQLLLVPLIALVLILIFQPPAVVALGLMILAASPGGASSGFLTHLARGHAFPCRKKSRQKMWQTSIPKCRKNPGNLLSTGW